jgi:hypothetical protein
MDSILTNLNFLYFPIFAAMLSHFGAKENSSMTIKQPSLIAITGKMSVL